MLHINIQATKLYFTPETMLVIAFYSYLSVECSLMVLQSLHAYFHSEKVLSLIDILVGVIIFNSLIFLKYV